MRGLTKENVLEAFKKLKEIEQKDLKQKMIVLRVYYISLIISIIMILMVILIKG